MSTVQVYVTSWCGYCRQAKRLLKKRDVPYEEINLDGDQAGRTELVRRTGQRTVPQIFIGSTHVGGSDDLHALDRAGRLEPLLVKEGVRPER
jgi:glutaredoxin 3